MNFNRQSLRMVCQQIFHFLVPPYCYYCHQFLSERRPLCARCLDMVQPVVSHSIIITEKKSVIIYAVGAYKEPLKNLILAKAGGDIHGSYQLGRLLWQQSVISHLDFDILVPIPLHWTRRASRGFNQAALMADIIAQKSGKPIVHALSRVRRTPFLSSITREKRQEMVADVFALRVNKELLAGKKILIIDDLMTTGSTIKSASRVLFTAKPESINGAVVCRAI